MVFWDILKDIWNNLNILHLLRNVPDCHLADQIFFYGIMMDWVNQSNSFIYFNYLLSSEELIKDTFLKNTFSI